MAKLYKIQTYFLDYNDEFKTASRIALALKCRMYGGILEHLYIAEADIGEWDDNHPLNIVDCPEAEYEKYFKEN